MLFSRFFNQPKPNRFGYTAVYYDKKKEEREQKIKEFSKELSKEKAEAKFNESDFRSRFSNQVGANRTVQKKHSFNAKGQNKKSNIRLLALIALMGIILYWQFK